MPHSRTDCEGWVVDCARATRPGTLALLGAAPREEPKKWHYPRRTNGPCARATRSRQHAGAPVSGCAHKPTPEGRPRPPFSLAPQRRRGRGALSTKPVVSPKCCRAVHFSGAAVGTRKGARAPATHLQVRRQARVPMYGLQQPRVSRRHRPEAQENVFSSVQIPVVSSAHLAVGTTDFFFYFVHPSVSFSWRQSTRHGLYQRVMCAFCCVCVCVCV